MPKSIVYFAVLFTTTSLSAQEIVTVKIVQPSIKLLVKQPNGEMLGTTPEILVKPGGFFSHISLRFFSHQGLLEETEISETQKSQLKKLRQSYEMESKKLVDEFNKSTNETKDKTEQLKLAKKFIGEVVSLQKKTADKIDTDLIPFQATILKKYAYRRLSYLSLPKIILTEPFVTDLKMSKKQKDEVTKIALERDKELQELIQKANENAKKKTIKLLNSDQRKYIEELTNKQK